MIKIKDDLTITTECNEKGQVKMTLSKLMDFDIKNPRLRTFAIARLAPGEEVEYHIHEGECEYYYIISGKGLYNDNGTEIEVVPETVTLTSSGSGHGIKNIGTETLEFVALIILD